MERKKELQTDHTWKPVLNIRLNRRRVGLPIRQDGAYKRLQEHLKENWKGYSYFKCAKCGYKADRDRVASLNIAERATHVADPAKGQPPLGDAPVSGRALKGEGCRWHQTIQSFKPTAFRRG